MSASEETQDVAVVGFRTWNRLDKNIRQLRQLYDFTMHLYAEEHERLQKQLRSAKPGQSIHTRIGLITHSLNSLVTHTSLTYPFRLRALLLIDLITHLETLLTDLAEEISRRDLTPFKIQERREFPQGQMLSFRTIESLQEMLISRELRRLTSGGLDEVARFYKTRFNTDIKNLSTDYLSIAEIHDRRHLHVHREGYCDAQYANRYPQSGFNPGERIHITQDYLIDAFETTHAFASEVRIEALKLFPAGTRTKRVIKGAREAPAFDGLVLQIRIEVLSTSYDAASQIPKVVVPDPSGEQEATIRDFLYQLTEEEGVVYLTVGGPQDRVNKVIGLLKATKEIEVRDVTELFSQRD